MKFFKKKKENTIIISVGEVQIQSEKSTVKKVVAEMKKLLDSKEVKNHFQTNLIQKSKMLGV